tara:strand:- start:1437 stop:2087 length:651 start_codon:yes stop_codon:yes gene_type:complete
MISENLKYRIYTSIVLLSLLLFIFNFNLVLIYFLIILGVLSILEFLEITQKIYSNKIILILINIFFITYIFTFCFMFFFFSNLTGLKIMLYILLFGCVASDIGGFVFGKLFKGPKLTRISPKKTYAGSIGSLIFTVLTMSSLFFYLLKSLSYQFIIISLITSIFCQLGDLLFSYLKRKAKLKDTGKFLPGHGGILDRIDGILFGIPIGFFSIILLN